MTYQNPTGILTKFGNQACEKHEYIEHLSGSQVVMTAWALIGLMNAEYPYISPLRHSINLLIDRQQANGEWKQEPTIEGVFNKSTMCSYPFQVPFYVERAKQVCKEYPDETVV
jgi:lanosterol synthase